MNEDDIYQVRYKNHLLRKKLIIANETGELDFYRYNKAEKKVLGKIMENRSSQRVFTRETVSNTEVKELAEAVRVAPSSCNRQAIHLLLICGEPNLKQVADLLVGGVGWADKADKMFLMFADMLAYKSPAEVDYMPYLDAGVVVQNLYLKAESLNIGACFVNPNIRPTDKEKFNELYNKNGLKFCGCMVFGKYDRKSAPNIKRSVEEVWI